MLLVGPLGARLYDAYALPKELAMHVVAVVAAAWLALGRRGLDVGRVELLVGVGVGWGFLAATMAVNPWMTTRPVALSVSAALIFWCARHLDRRAARAVLRAVAVAALLLGLWVLLETYGVVDRLAMAGRAPAGPAANRNYAAHLAVIALPVVAYLALTARRPRAFALWAVAAGVPAAVIVLSRSRAAWLALAVLVVAAAIAYLLATRSEPRRCARPGLLAAALVTAVTIAVLAPNALRWSDGGYAGTLRALVAHDRGTGRGRVIQYRRTLELVAANPILGVGPDNWPIAYFQGARPGDPNVEKSRLQPVNRLPNSDWLGLVSERGLPAGLAFAGAAMALLLAARRSDERGAGLAAAAVIAGVAIMGTFDAVLLRSEPLLITAAALGCLVPLRPDDARWTIQGRARTAVGVAAVILALLAAADTGRRYAAHLLRTGDAAARATALRLDPGDYQLRCAAAMKARRHRDCEAAKRHARRALSLFPGLPHCVAVLRSCANEAERRPR